jgi:hypothetical protein
MDKKTQDWVRKETTAIFLCEFSLRAASFNFSPVTWKIFSRRWSGQLRLLKMPESEKATQEAKKVFMVLHTIVSALYKASKNYFESPVELAVWILDHVETKK